MSWHRQRGATLFEFAVSAAVWGTLAAVLLWQILRYQAEAELTGVKYQLGSLRTALAGKTMELSARGDTAAIGRLAGSNPVLLLQHAPPNYLGEYDDPQPGRIGSGHWYFDRKQQTLVYLFTGNKNFSGSAPAQWKFRVELTRLPTNNAKPPGTPAPETGVALQEVDG